MVLVCEACRSGEGFYWCFVLLSAPLLHDLPSSHIPGKKWKKTCCVPSFVLFALTLGCLITGMALLAIFKVG